MLIYRYENENGYGPYSFDRYKDNLTYEEEQLNEILVDKLDFNLHPMPDLDLYSGVFDDYFFGCKSINQLNVWFDKEIRYWLNLCGFKLKIYDCPDEFCIVEESQIGFLIEKAEQLEI